MENRIVESAQNERGGYEVRIDEQLCTLHRATPTGKELLAKVGRNPDEYLLTHVLPGEPDRIIEPDEAFDLSAPGVEQLALVSKKRYYSIRIDETTYQVPSRTPTGRDLLKLAAKKTCSHFLVQILEGRDDELVDPDETVDLAERGTERFAIVIRDTVTVTVDDKAVELPRGTISVHEIKRRGGVADGYVLVHDDGGRLVPLENDGTVNIHGCEVFTSHVAEGGAS